MANALNKYPPAATFPSKRKMHSPPKPHADRRLQPALASRHGHCRRPARLPGQADGLRPEHRPATTEIHDPGGADRGPQGPVREPRGRGGRDVPGQLRVRGRRSGPRAARLQSAREQILAAEQHGDQCFWLGHRGHEADDQRGVDDARRRDARVVAVAKGIFQQEVVLGDFCIGSWCEGCWSFWVTVGLGYRDGIESLRVEWMFLTLPNVNFIGIRFIVRSQTSCYWAFIIQPI